MSSKGYELVQLAKNLVIDANGTITDLNIDTTNIDNLVNIDLAIAPEILEIQVSAPQAGQDTAWLWTWEQSTLPYARRTITNSPEVSVPLYRQGQYVVNNFAAYDLFDQMTQTHSLYLKWIDGAGTDNLVSWATSTGPVSDSHPDINGGAATDVQRITVNVPATITLPTLTAPSVSYTVTNNGAGAYTFSGAAKGDNPNIGPFYRGGTYTFNISATGHPLYLTTDNGTNFASGTYFGEYTDGVTGSRTDNGTLTITVPSDAPDTLYYQCGNHGVMRGAITVKDLAVETNNNGNPVIYFQHTQEGHKTPIELRPIPSLVNQMCLVYDSSSGKFVPQDLATYVENTPSFENKIREVAGTAELVVEDGSAVVAKVNVYDDSTYLPLTGNNAGDQAFATDTNILYIWDGSAWQQAGTTNSDDLTEGSTNLFYTDSRADARVNIAVANLVDTAPTTLDTLNELAAALGDDPNFATTVTNSIATKANSADLATVATTGAYADLSGTPSIPSTTSDISEGTNQYFTQARVQATPINAGSLRGTVNNATVQYGTAYSGTPVQGSFFFDSLNQKLKVYTGSAFVDAVPAGTGGGSGGGETAANATFRKYTYSITSSTNAVSGADDNLETLSYVTDGTQNVEVYVNGVKQVEGGSNDYVASTGTSVTFVDNLSSGDVVDIQVYELLTNDAYYLKTETYTQTEVNTQIATGLSSYLPLGGGAMTGDLTFGTNGRLQTNGVIRYGSASVSAEGALSYGSNLITLEALSTNTSIRIDPNGTGGVISTGNVSIQTDNTGGTVLSLQNSDTGGRTWYMYSTGSGNGEGAGHFLLNNGTSVPLIVTDTGRLGVGTIDPVYKLDVRGSIGVGRDLTNTTELIKSFSTVHASGNRGGNIRFGISDGGYAGVEVVNEQGSNASYNSQSINFHTHNGAIDAGARMSIRYDGRVNADWMEIDDVFVLPRLATAPSNPTAGQMYYNTSTGAVQHWDGNTWVTTTNRITSTGGIENTYTDNGVSYKSHTFTSSGTFTIDGGTTVDVMVVAGGGAGGGHGGNDGSGGGGAGGMVVQTGINISAGSFSVIVGGGGAGVGGATRGNNGDNSSISGLGVTTAVGGGGGGTEGTIRIGKDGGSGGGAGGYGVKSGGLGTSGQGNNGGNCTAPGDGGGGGKGAPGASGSTGNGGVGEINRFKDGTDIYYAGGGGGSGDQRNPRGSGGGTGGNGGGGNGANATSGSTPQNGTSATGGGGGGAAGQNYAGAYTSGNGGSGVVIIRYAI